MYLSRLVIRNFRQFGDDGAALDMTFNKGVTALIGRNDSGKTAIIDAIRYAMLTRDQDFVRIQPDDFHIDKTGKQSADAVIRCTLGGLNEDEKGAFVEYLSYVDDEVCMVVTWTARRLSESPGSRRWVDVAVRSGIDGGGPAFEPSARELLSSTYLRPLRDAEREMSAGRSSRLSQILYNVQGIDGGDDFDQADPPLDAAAIRRLSLVGLSDYVSFHVKQHKGVSDAEEAINAQYLSSLSLKGDALRGKIDLTEGGTPQARLRQILERLELGLFDSTTDSTRGRYGLGSHNLLYIACELLLLSREPEGLPLLLIEEPEAHLHPQRQLRLMEFLEQVAKETTEESRRAVQVVLSTHSPNLASKIPLENIQLLEGGRAHSLAKDQTRLEKGDYRFLQRFLDATKANLFFAQGVMIVEGDAEAILLPVIAQLLGANLTEHGISIVNVGGTGLRRYSRIFQRRDDKAPALTIPVACITDMDVMPDCAPQILGLVNNDDDPKWTSPKRRWKSKRHFGDVNKSQASALEERRMRLKADDGQSVKTFVSDHWTLEYDLAYCGLEKLVYYAACLAMNDDPLNSEKKDRDAVVAEAKLELAKLVAEAKGDRTVLCTHVYEPFHARRASKAIAAQHLSSMLLGEAGKPDFDKDAFATKLPRYIVEGIAHLKKPGELPLGVAAEP